MRRYALVGGGTAHDDDDDDDHDDDDHNGDDHDDVEGLHMIVQGLSKVYEGNGEGWFEVLKYLALPIFKIERCIAADEKFS